MQKRGATDCSLTLASRAAVETGWSERRTRIRWIVGVSVRGAMPDVAVLFENATTVGALVDVHTVNGEPLQAVMAGRANPATHTSSTKSLLDCAQEVARQPTSDQCKRRRNDEEEGNDGKDEDEGEGDEEGHDEAAEGNELESFRDGPSDPIEHGRIVRGRSRADEAPARGDRQLFRGERRQSRGGQRGSPQGRVRPTPFPGLRFPPTAIRPLRQRRQASRTLPVFCRCFLWEPAFLRTARHEARL